MATHAERTHHTEQPDGALAEPDAVTVLPSEDFDWLLRLLDQPDEPMPKIAQAAARQRERATFRQL
jgi:uncharacterized protein (DUF1778 family)